MRPSCECLRGGDVRRNRAGTPAGKPSMAASAMYPRRSPVAPQRGFAGGEPKKLTPLR
jgi:hypothetical protein